MPYYTWEARAGITKSICNYHDRSRPEPGMGRRKKTKPTPESQRKNNMRRAAQRLTLDLNENFGPDCWYLTWNYSPDKRPRIEGSCCNR